VRPNSNNSLARKFRSIGAFKDHCVKFNDIEFRGRKREREDGERNQEIFRMISSQHKRKKDEGSL
jgi:hypothetical protein